MVAVVVNMDVVKGKSSPKLVKQINKLTVFNIFLAAVMGIIAGGKIITEWFDLA